MAKPYLEIAMKVFWPYRGQPGAGDKGKQLGVEHLQQLEQRSITSARRDS